MRRDEIREEMKEEKSEKRKMALYRKMRAAFTPLVTSVRLAWRLAL